MSTPLTFGYYHDHSTPAPARMISVLELAEMAADPSTAKHPHIAAFAQHNGMAKTKDAAQLAQFAMIVTDHDDDDKTRQQIEQLYDVLGAPYLAFTTSSHLLSQNKGGKPVTPSRKWKVVVPLAEAVDAETFGWISQGIAQSLCTDTAQTRITQIAYVPNVIAEGNPYEFINKLGDPSAWLHPDDDCDFMVEARTGWAELQRRETAEVKAKPKPRPTIAGEKAGIVEKTIDYYSGDIGAVITSRGYKRRGSKYLSPFSNSGAAGVSILEENGKQYVYSHHSASDPLSAHNHSGHRLDLFDVLVALDHGDDFEAAIKHYAPLVDPEGQRQRQREYCQNQAQQAAYDAFDTSTANDAPAQQPASNSPYKPFDDTQPYNLFGTFALPALPMDLIPSAIADYSADQGELIGADPAAMVLFCLGVAGACIDDRLKIQVKRHDPTWTESARLWCGVIGDPSVKKSPLLSKALAPAFAIDSEWRQETNKAMAEWRKECENTPKGEDEPPMPIGKRLLLNDATVEKVGDILSKCEPRGMLSYQDELSGWLASMDAYKGGAGGKDKGAWLEAFNGGAKFIDRVSRGELYIENWSVSVLGGIQPSVIQSYAQTTNHDGMLQRFILLYAQQPKELGQDRHPQPFAKAGYNELIKHLAMLEPSANPVKLSECAHKHREALERKVHALVCNHPNPHLTAALGKWSGLYARLLLVWHCCDSHSKQKYPTGYEVTGETAEKVAVFMWRVLLPHLLKFYGAIDPFEDSSQNLARLILAKGWQRFTVKRDFNQQWRASRKMKPWEIEQVLERLEGFNWIAPDPLALRNANGTPSAYLVNPEVHALHAEQAQAERDRRQEVAAALAELQASHA